MTSMELKHRAKLKEWSEKIQECRSSELSVTQWCQLQGCTTTTYYRWERELLSLAETEPKRLEAPVVEFEALPAVQLYISPAGVHLHGVSGPLNW